MNGTDKKKAKVIIQESINRLLEFEGNTDNNDYFVFENCSFVGELGFAYQMGLITFEEYETYREILNSIVESKIEECIKEICNEN